MAAVGEQDHVAGFEDTAFKVGLIVVVEVDPHAARFNEQNLLGVLHLARHRVVDVGRDHIAAGSIHVTQLLGEVAGGEELDAFSPITSAKNNCKQPGIAGDVLYQVARANDWGVGHEL